jgi:hypothetical protein
MRVAAHSSGRVRIHHPEPTYIAADMCGPAEDTRLSSIAVLRCRLNA